MMSTDGLNLEHKNKKEVFDDIRRSPFSLKEAAEYLDVAEITLRRWIKAGKLNFNRIGRNFVFDPDELKTFKRATLS